MSSLEGGTPLHQAAKAGNIQDCKDYLANGADIMARDHALFTPFMDSVRSGFKIEILLAHNAMFL